VNTGRELTVNIPDIMNKNEKQKTCKPIDVAISEDRNFVQKKAEETRIKGVITEIKQMWNLKCNIIPVLIRAN